MSLAEVRLCCGRHCLIVAGVVVAMEGDRCRDSSMPESVLPSIPPEELEHATIGGKLARDLPLNVVHFFRGHGWTLAILEWAAAKINAASGEKS